MADTGHEPNKLVITNGGGVDIYFHLPNYKALFMTSAANLLQALEEHTLKYATNPNAELSIETSIHEA